MYLLDTNVISETRRANRADGNVRAWLNTIDPAEMYTSAIVMMELERGVLGMECKDGQQGGILHRWLEEVVKPTFKDRILPINETTAEICARLHIPDKSPENDAWIAATAKQHGLTLATRNIKDFEHSGVKLINLFETV